MEYRRLDQVGRGRLPAMGDGRAYYGRGGARLDETAQATGTPSRRTALHRSVPKEGRRHLGGYQVARPIERLGNLQPNLGWHVGKT